MSSGGVHDLFRDMYGGQTSMCADAFRSSPANTSSSTDTSAFYPRPPPPAAPPAYTSPPAAHPNVRQMPIQVVNDHSTPHVAYRADYQERRRPEPQYVAQVNEDDSSVPEQHFVVQRGGADPHEVRSPQSPYGHSPRMPLASVYAPDASNRTPSPYQGQSPTQQLIRASSPRTSPNPYYGRPSPVNATPEPVSHQFKPISHAPASTPVYPAQGTRFAPVAPTLPPQPATLSPSVRPSRGPVTFPARQPAAAPSGVTRPVPLGSEGARVGPEDLGFPAPPPEASVPARMEDTAPEPITPTTFPPPPPPPPSPPQPDQPSQATKSAQDAQYATRLNKKLANMNFDNTPETPYNYGGHSSPGGYPAYNPAPTNYNDYYGGSQSPAPYSPNYYASPVQPAPPMAPPLPPQQQPVYRSAPTPPPAMPDAVLNMAAKGAPDKKPWAYAPDPSMLKEHRDRVRRRGGGSLPKYQNLLNMPSFENLPPTPQQRAPPRQTPQTAYPLGPQGATVAHAQYNSPLNIYSDENVSDAFTGQTDGQVMTVRSGAGKASGPDITQSATYKMIHGLDEPAPQRPQRHYPEAGYHHHPVRQPSADDELSFSGVRSDTYDHIPSKAFHKLQSLTGGGEVDRTSIRQGVSGADEDEVGNYNEASIRYRGGNIPSRSFRMLQSMTGEDTDPTPVATKPSRRILRRAESAPGPRDDDEGVDISYVGGNIPSRSFKMLQQSVGEPTDYDSGVQNGMGEPLVVRPSGPSDQATPEEQHQAALERRRRRRRRGSLGRAASQSPNRPIVPREQPHEARPEFDEGAYLSGRVAILRAEDELPSRPYKKRMSVEEAARAQERLREEREAMKERQGEDFDEQAWLQGQTPVWGGDTRHIRAAGPAPKPRQPWEKDEGHARPFDEEAFLAGQLNIINDPETAQNLPPRAPRKETSGVKPDWARTVEHKKRDKAFERSLSSLARDKKREADKAARQYIYPDKDEDDTNYRDFDERAYLTGNVPIFDDTPKAPRPMTTAEVQAREVHEFQALAEQKKKADFVDPLKASNEAAENMPDVPDEDDTAKVEPFDEQKFLEGSTKESSVPKEIPDWVKRKEEAAEKPAHPFDEQAYLFGCIPLVSGGTPDLMPVLRKKAPKPKEDEEEEELKHEAFDEDDFLAGRIPVLRGSVDQDTTPREPRLEPEREFAPWERRDAEEQPYHEEEFDEDQFLRGRVPVVRRSVERELPETEEANQRIRSRTFLRLSRSVSRDSERPLSPSGYDSAPCEADRTSTTPRKPRSRKPKYDRSRSLSPREAKRRQVELQQGTTKDVPIDDLMYKGTHIPSKTFLKLRSHVDRPGAVEQHILSKLYLETGPWNNRLALSDTRRRLKRGPAGADRVADPLESLRGRWNNDEYDSDADEDNVDIREHSPEIYFDAPQQQSAQDRQVNGEVGRTPGWPSPAGPPAGHAGHPGGAGQKDQVVKTPTEPPRQVRIISRAKLQPQAQVQPQPKTPPQTAPKPITKVEIEDEVTDF